MRPQDLTEDPCDECSIETNARGSKRAGRASCGGDARRTRAAAFVGGGQERKLPAPAQLLRRRRAVRRARCGRELGGGPRWGGGHGPGEPGGPGGWRPPLSRASVLGR